MKTKKVWVSRDRWMNSAGECWLYSSKRGPESSSDGDVWSLPNRSALNLQMEADDFKALFGFTPRKGSCKQYNLTLEEIK